MVIKNFKKWISCRFGVLIVTLIENFSAALRIAFYSTSINNDTDDPNQDPKGRKYDKQNEEESNLTFKK